MTFVCELQDFRDTTVMELARALADRPGLAVLESSPRGALRSEDARSSFVTCDPIKMTDALVPVVTTEALGWNGLPAAPRCIGVVPYEALRSVERSPRENRKSPEIELPKWLHYAAVLRIDHLTGTRVIEADDRASAEKLLALLHRQPQDERAFQLRPIADEDDETAHADRIRRALEFIAAGDIYQINLARRLSFSFEGSALDLFSNMVRRAPSPYSVFLDLGTTQICGTSPELALEVRGNRMRTSPIKGTRPRGSDQVRDDALVAELESNPNEHAELTMAIDLHRNDLGRVAEFGSVRVLGDAKVVTGKTIHHRVAEIVATRARGASLEEIVRAFLPAGSVTGAPKIRAMEIIRELETSRRGLYTGAMGYVGRDGSLVLAMAIRTATITGTRAHYFSGGGIVWGKDPEREVEETRWKAAQIATNLPTSP